MFAGPKLPLRTWMLALHLLTSTKTNMAALELMRHLWVNYKTAWRMEHKIMQVMAEREATRKLSGCVQIDDAYLGGERNGGKAGRGSENKQSFLIAMQTDAAFTSPRCVVIEPVRSFDNASLKDWTARRLAPECKVYTDAWPASVAWKRPAWSSQEPIALLALRGTRRELVARAQDIIDRNARLMRAAPMGDSTSSAIARCCQDLEKAHLFDDGNARTMSMLVVSKLLLENGLRTAMMEDPNRFDGVRPGVG